MIVAEGRLLGQWHDELTRGAPGRGLPPLAPNVEVLVIDERRPIAGQIRAFDTRTRRPPGVVLVPNGALDRYPADLQVIPWHLLIADEALRYANPATEAHQALEAGAVRVGRGLLAPDRHPEGQERRASRRAGRARGRRRGDDHRAAEHPRGRRSDGRDQRPPAAGQLRPAPGARHPPRHAGLDARRPARQTLGDRPRPRAPASCSTRSAKADARPTADCSRSCASSRRSRPAASCSSRRSPNSPAPRASFSAMSACMWTPVG